MQVRPKLLRRGPLRPRSETGPVGPAIQRWHYALLAGLVLGGIVWGLQGGLLTDAVLWLQATQRDLHRQLVQSMHAVADGRARASFTLIVGSLIYGVFHAAGPGHGKAVIATYLGTNPILLRRGILLSVLGSLFQGLIAILIVEGSVRALGLSARRVQEMGAGFENLSFILVCVLGATLILRAIMALRRQLHAARVDRDDEPLSDTRAAPSGSLFDGGGQMQAYCGACGVLHSPARQHIEQPIPLRSAITVILSMGLRPCAGALLVLVAARALNIPWAGVGAAFAMSIGTSCTVAALATATVYSRAKAAGFLNRLTGGARPLQVGFTIASMLGGIVLLILGIGLLTQGLVPSPHPLLAP